MAGLTYDTAPLIAAERGDARFWTIHRRWVAQGDWIVVPVVILAQAWRGGSQARLSQALLDCIVEPMLEADAREIGVALARSNTSDVPDAAVVVSALRRGDAVVTGDRRDLERIAAALGRRLSIIDI